MSAPAVSAVVVVRAGHRASSVDATLRSLAGLAAQDHGRIEVVVVHAAGGPVPAGPTTLEVRHVDVAGWGSVAARSRGLDACTGELVVLLEAGDRLLPGALRAGTEELTAHPGAGFAFGRSRGAGRAGLEFERSEDAREVHADHYVELLRGDYVGPACASLFRRSALHLAGMRDRGGADLDDYALHLRLARIAPVRYHGRLVAEHGRGPGPGSAAAATRAVRALRAQRPFLGDEPHYLEAYEEGMQRLVTRFGVRIGNEIRAHRAGPARSRARGVAAAAGLAPVVLGAYPRGVPVLLRSEVVPWVARRRPGWRRLERLLAPRDRPPRLHPRHAVAATVRTTVPAGAELLVLGTEDPDADLADRKVRHLPLDGRPGATADVARALEAAEFVLVPAESFWDVDRRHPQLGRRLRASFETAWADRTCRIHRRAAAPAPQPGRALVAGYFSFDGGHATAGDLMVRDVVCAWLDEAGRPYDVALAPPFPGGVDWRAVDPRDYSHVVFACGPFHPDLPSRELLRRFPRATSIGVNLSMPVPLEEWNPFDVLLERDSSRTSRPDLGFASTQPTVPVVGVCLREHADGTRTAHAAVERLLASTPMAVVPIDTRLDETGSGANPAGQRTAAEVEALIARMDVVVTTRLHGLVLALKNGVPAVAIDPGNEGSKILRQAEAVGWPVAFGVDGLTDGALAGAFRHCLTAEARAAAADCARRARTRAAEVREALVAALSATPPAGAGGAR
ncbi:MAG TPA: polysaccharide pyruvyl transferase family protein [Pseudonocardia sp.]|nr:polysaccharide pyruvyl transferase family protein [Pseudonocardia sp.]